jgi:hypothetical protein
MSTSSLVLMSLSFLTLHRLSNNVMNPLLIILEGLETPKTDDSMFLLLRKILVTWLIMV